MLNSVNCSTIICSPTVQYLSSREKPVVKPMVLGSIFIILFSYYFAIYFAFILLCIFIIKIPKILSLSYLSDLTLVSGPIGIDNPSLRWLQGFICFVRVRGTCAKPPTGFIPWFSKTEGNTYATLLHHPFLFGENQRSSQEVASNDQTKTAFRSPPISILHLYSQYSDCIIIFLLVLQLRAGIDLHGQADRASSIVSNLGILV